jgi:hypothetical protein
MRKNKLSHLIAGLAVLTVLGLLVGCGSDPTTAAITSSPGDEESAPILPPGNLQGAPKAGAVSLDWDASPSTGVTHYTVYAGSKGGLFFQVGRTSRTEFQYPNLIPGNGYWFHVTASSPDRESGASNSVFVRMPENPSIGDENPSKKFTF